MCRFIGLQRDNRLRRLHGTQLTGIVGEQRSTRSYTTKATG